MACESSATVRGPRQRAIHGDRVIRARRGDKRIQEFDAQFATVFHFLRATMVNLPWVRMQGDLTLQQEAHTALLVDAGCCERTQTLRLRTQTNAKQCTVVVARKQQDQEKSVERWEK